MIVRLDTRNLFDPLLGKGLGVGRHEFEDLPFGP